MCGIAALFGTEVQSRDMLRMLGVAARRGPEGTALRAVRGGVLGHAALRFVDVEHNQQPLATREGACLVWNGELYNWRELSAQYALGARNDSQALLFGLLSRGPDFLRELDGQLAFVAQLPRDGELITLVGRDRWGICPLVFGWNARGELALGSTPETLQAAGVRDAYTVPAGTFGRIRRHELQLESYFELPRPAPAQQRWVSLEEVQQLAVERVLSRIPERTHELFSTLGGMDSQFVTATLARALRGELGGAVTVVPWDAAEGGDLPQVRETLALLEREGVHVRHHVVALTPEFVREQLDRLLSLLGPDLFHILCGLAEDRVAAEVQRLGGRVIMTAGGPDEAGRSYDRWTFLHQDLDLELAWWRLAAQFGSSEGVRAGLVFGERGIENRVPLADLIMLATQMRPEQKQRIDAPGDGLHLASLRMEGKLFWKQALAGLLPESSLAARKQPVHGSTGAMPALHALLREDAAFASAREAFAWRAYQLGWNAIVFGDLRQLDRDDPITECQLYALYRWSALQPELFALGGPHRYGEYQGYLPRSEDDPLRRAYKPLCHDWQLGPGVPIRPVR
jgi:asparagine synthase (glutamine-hydrolysing)